MNPKCPICRGIGWVCENHPDIGFRTGLRVQGRRALQVQQDRRHRRAGRHPAYRPGPAAAAPLAASGREAQLGHQAQRGGLNSPASQPTAAVIMGSTEIEICSVRSQVEHSNVRTTKPRSPGDIRASAIRCRHTGHIGLSFIAPSHYLATPPIPPAAAKPGPGAKARAGFERSLDLDDWRAAKGSLYSDVTYRVLITASREASYRSGSLARMETKGGRDGYPGCPLNGRRRRDSTRERYPLALVYFPPEAIERPRRGFGSSTRGPNIVMHPAPT